MRSYISNWLSPAAWTEFGYEIEFIILHIRYM